MSGPGQSGVGIAAVGLLGANLFFPAPGSAYEKDKSAITGTLFGGNVTPAAGHAALVRVGLGLLGVVVVIMVAGMGGQWTIGAAAIVAALWVLWAINRYSVGGVNKGGGAS